MRISRIFSLMIYSNSNYKLLTNSTHLLIAGVTGSGKSVALRGIIKELLLNSPAETRLIIIDPKRVDFLEFKSKPPPHLLQYANSTYKGIEALETAVEIMERRYSIMERQGLKLYNGSAIFIIIDEYADLHDTGKKAVEDNVIRLCQLGRAAKIHCFIATQRAVSCVNTRIRANLDYRLALRTVNQKESVNIIDCKGAELLPRFGYGLLLSPFELATVELPYVSEEEIDTILAGWHSLTNQVEKKQRKRFRNFVHMKRN